MSGAKLALLVGTLSFITVVWWLLDDLVLGYAIWAVFHDVQYFAIVWIYGRGLTGRGGGAGGAAAASATDRASRVPRSRIFQMKPSK